MYCKSAGNNQELSGMPGMGKILAKMEKVWMKKFLVKGRLFLPAVCLCLHLTSYCTGVQAAVIQVDWHSHHPTLCFCKIVTTHKTTNISTVLSTSQWMDHWYSCAGVMANSKICMKIQCIMLRISQK
jgi:hypothetical protein